MVLHKYALCSVISTGYFGFDIAVCSDCVQFRTEEATAVLEECYRNTCIVLCLIKSSYLVQNAQKSVCVSEVLIANLSVTLWQQLLFASSLSESTRILDVPAKLLSIDYWKWSPARYFSTLLSGISYHSLQSSAVLCWAIGISVFLHLVACSNEFRRNFLPGEKDENYRDSNYCKLSQIESVWELRRTLLLSP